MRALICANCGGPLSHPKGGQTYVQCVFCAVTCHIGEAGLVVDAATATEGMTDRREIGELFIDRLGELMGKGKEMLAALEEVASEALEDPGQVKALVNVVGNLVYDFDRAEGTEARKDPLAVGRFAKEYLQLFEEIAEEGSAELNLPFITATESGPRHYMDRLSPARLEQLANKTPVFAAASSGRALSAGAPSFSEDAALEEGGERVFPTEVPQRKGVWVAVGIAAALLAALWALAILGVFGR